MRTRIYDFKEQDSGSSLTGRLTMDVELQNTKTGDTVWQTYYNHDEPISAKTVPDVVAALNTKRADGRKRYRFRHGPVFRRSSAKIIRLDSSLALGCTVDF